MNSDRKSRKPIHTLNSEILIGIGYVPNAVHWPTLSSQISSVKGLEYLYIK